MDSLRQDSCGEIRCTVGTIIERQDIHGGFQDCIMYSRCMMLSESIISVDLMNTFQFRMGQRMRSEDIGRKVLESICSAKWNRHLDGSRLFRESGFPGMKVLEFAFDSRDSGCANDYLPHNYPVNSVAYTGTHDNETIVGWWSSITKEEQKLARDYMCDQYTPESELYKSLISLIMRSSAKLCVIPMQDYLGLGNNCRINTPSTVGKNWKWRVNTRQLSLKLQKEIQEMTLRYGRMNWETVE